MNATCAHDEVIVVDPATEHPIAVYLDRAGVAEHLGLKSVKSLSGIKLPPHDALIGNNSKGWLPSTIDEWNRNRPGRGRWGSREDEDSVAPR